MPDCHIDNAFINNSLKGKSIILFGAGADGKSFLKFFGDKVNVKYFIDNASRGCTESLFGVPIYSIDFLQKDYLHEPIIITSSRYKEEIAKQLSDLGYLEGKNFFIWQKNNLDRFDINVQKFINHNRENWKRKEAGLRPNTVLLELINIHDTIFVPWSYCANYLADKYNAEIICCPFMKIEGFDDNNLASESVWNVYESFNAKEKVYPELNASQINKADQLFELLWNNLKSKQDWYNIEIEGKNFGKQICAYYIRLIDPTFDIMNPKMKHYLQCMIRVIVFWQDYFAAHSELKAMISCDGLYMRNIIQVIASEYDVDFYAIDAVQGRKCDVDIAEGSEFKYYKQFFKELSDSEKEYGIEWGRTHLNNRLQGDKEDISYMECSPYSFARSKKVLNDDNKIKVMICPHCFQDYPYACGSFFFSDHYEWLSFLGKISERTSYDWYLKIHPAADKLDKLIWQEIVEKYPKIKMLPQDVSVLQLRDEGIRFALTVWGTLGHEYPALGIQVINSGNNPHIAFDFDWNPKSIEEYEKLLLNLDNLHKKVDMNEIYQFYCIHYLYYQRRNRDRSKVFFKDERLCHPIFDDCRKVSTENYNIFINECNNERHKQLLQNTKAYMEEMDSYKEGIFYKNKI